MDLAYHGACDACGGLDDGARCASCDVVLCGGCLAATERCPSCQRPIDGAVAAGSSGVLADRGRRQLRAAALPVFVALALFATTASAFAVLVWMVSLAALLFATARGGRVARWLLRILCAVMPAVVLLNLRDGVVGLVEIGVAATHLGLLFALGMSPAITALMRSGARRF